MMYFIELLAKKIFGVKKQIDSDERTFNYEQSEDKIKDCEEHVFMPIDSSGEVLSCINCGLVVHKEDLSKTNPF